MTVPAEPIATPWIPPFRLAPLAALCAARAPVERVLRSDGFALVLGGLIWAGFVAIVVRSAA